jgi:hypothetical protein
LAGKLAQTVAGEGLDALRQRLRDERPAMRWAAAQVAGTRRLPLAAELIGLLDDPSAEVARAAHDALVRVVRGTDFGPLPGMTKARRARAVARWKSWLAAQPAGAADARARGADGPAAAPGRAAPSEGARPSLAPVEFFLRTEDGQAARLGAELVRARGPEQEKALRRLQRAEGRPYTLALARAIPQLPEAARARAREALAGRLAGLTAPALRDRLQDADAEVRRAAADACSRKPAKGFVPDLIALVADPDAEVAQAARRALRALTGEDFGPRGDGTSGERARALAAWQGWWKRRPPPGK